MRRREFIVLFGGIGITGPLVAHGQQGERMRRVGVLMNRAADDPQGKARVAAFKQGLQQLGWEEGRNVRIDTRWGEDEVERERKYAAELIALAPDVILSSGSLSATALQHAGGHHAHCVCTRCRSGRRRTRQ
jgi:putative ABC transport system substrate-binding protein